MTWQIRTEKEAERRLPYVKTYRPSWVIKTGVRNCSIPAVV